MIYCGATNKRQLGDDFNLTDFHDQLMAAGRLPLSLIRWEMTGNDEGIARTDTLTRISNLKPQISN